jgi:hypothetical protein
MTLENNFVKMDNMGIVVESLDMLLRFLRKSA